MRVEADTIDDARRIFAAGTYSQNSQALRRSP
jgi:hypothetical protein